MSHASPLSHFLHSFLSLVTLQFFVHIVWIVGEYAAPSLDARCNTAVMVQYHEVLEVFAYEVNMVLETAEAETVNAAYAVRCSKTNLRATHCYWTFLLLYLRDNRFWSGSS